MGETETDRKPQIANRKLSWHGWSICLPARWDPVKLEGDFDKGMILLADLHRPRLGVKWTKLGKKADVAKAVRKSLLAEVGQLAAAEATAGAPPGENWSEGRLYIEPEPPGRDVWIGYSKTTGRLFEIVYHAKHRDRGMVETVLPALADGSVGEWSIFDLACKLPGEARLERQALNVGDLRLDFLIGQSPIVVRQIAVASLALSRQPLEKWLIGHQNGRKKFYRPAEKPQEIECSIDGRVMKGLGRNLKRRWRYFFMWRLPKQIVGLALRDEARDKLLIIEAADEKTVRDVFDSLVARATSS
jgi:hypothetical protein